MSYPTPIPLQAASLREWILSKQPGSSPTESTSTNSPKSFQIVDVRDDDYVGGHITGSVNVPSRQLPSRVDDLADELSGNEAVVFTCALSQQRGPNAAQKYLNRLRERGIKGQRVYVLKDGFFGWQARYGQDKALTQDWDKDAWEFYM